MVSAKYPVTPAVRVLREAGVSFTPHIYEYVEKGGTSQSAQVLGVNEHAVIKTLVLETDARAPILVLMHGDRELATGTLARQLGVKSVRLCDAATAQKWTGYQFGGTSPFGTKTPKISVYVERTILALPEVFVNGGQARLSPCRSHPRFLWTWRTRRPSMLPFPFNRKTLWLGTHDGFQGGDLFCECIAL